MIDPQEGSDVSFAEIDRRVIKEFKLYFNLLISSFNNNDLCKECDYIGRLSKLIATLEGYSVLPPALRKMVDRVKEIRDHIENIHSLESLDPEIQNLQKNLDKMG